MENQELKKKFNRLKEKLSDISHNVTLKKYKILSEAYNIGKEIYGREYSYFRLSFDLEVPYTTVKRICSLDRANFNTWKLINEKKITSFKVAQIIHQHGPTYQDELIKLTIDNNLSTYEIREFRCKSLADVRELRLRVAVNKGFARQTVAYHAFKIAMERMTVLMTIEHEYLPKRKMPIIIKDMKKLIKGMEEFSDRISQNIKDVSLEVKNEKN